MFGTDVTMAQLPTWLFVPDSVELVPQLAAAIVAAAGMSATTI
jgi:hypothetical protein